MNLKLKKIVTRALGGIGSVLEAVGIPGVIGDFPDVAENFAILGPMWSAAAVGAGTVLFFVWAVLEAEKWFTNRDRAQQKDVLRTIRALNKSFSKFSGKGGNPSPNVTELRRRQIWQAKLRDLGLSPERAGFSFERTGEPVAWDCYLYIILPTVEEIGVKEAVRDTRRMGEVLAELFVSEP